MLVVFLYYYSIILLYDFLYGFLYDFLYVSKNIIFNRVFSMMMQETLFFVYFKTFSLKHVRNAPKMTP